MWCIKRGQDAAFVCQMETVLEVYQRPFDPTRPLVCMDETAKQCTREVRTPVPTTTNHPERYDAQYLRNGVGHLLLFYAPLENWREVHLADSHDGVQWAHGVRHLLEERYPDAERVTQGNRQPVHPRRLLALPGVQARARPGAARSAGAGLHPETWQLVEHGRVRVQRAGPTVPGSSDRGPLVADPADQRLEERA